MENLRRHLESVKNDFITNFSVIKFETTSKWNSVSTNGDPIPTTQDSVSSRHGNQIRIYDENVDPRIEDRNFYHQMPDLDSEKSTFSWSSANISCHHATILLPIILILNLLLE